MRISGAVAPFWQSQCPASSGSRPSCLWLCSESAGYDPLVANVLPLASALPGVVTVHDLSFVRMPEKFPPAKRFYLTRLCAASVAKARRVIAVSRQTADDLMACFG